MAGATALDARKLNNQDKEHFMTISEMNKDLPYRVVKENDTFADNDIIYLDGDSGDIVSLITKGWLSADDDASRVDDSVFAGATIKPAIDYVLIDCGKWHGKRLMKRDRINGIIHSWAMDNVLAMIDKYGIDVVEVK